MELGCRIRSKAHSSNRIFVLGANSRWMPVTTEPIFSEIEPYASGRLPLGGSHVMYWEQAGNPQGTPVLFLHGGPGAGAAAAHRRFFDPRYYRSSSSISEDADARCRMASLQVILRRILLLTSRRSAVI